jgi:hypothetical protein
MVEHTISNDPLVHVDMRHYWDSNPINVLYVNGKRQEQTELYTQHCHTNTNVMHFFTQVLGKFSGIKEVSKNEDTLYTTYEIQTLLEHTHTKKGSRVQEGNTTASETWSQLNRRQRSFNNCGEPSGQKMSPQRIQPGPGILAEGTTASYRTWSQRRKNRNFVGFTWKEPHTATLFSM